MMGIDAYIAFVVSLIVALATVSIIGRIHGIQAKSERFESLDGLRGYLAFFVFLHHAGFWFFYLKTGEWKLSSQLFVHLGQSSVALFFMITGFLFFNKILAGSVRPIDWTRLYISRILRLFPMYLFAVIVIFGCVFTATDWQLNTRLSDLVNGMLRWLLFTMPGTPDLNGVKNTNLIIAGVTWSLRYEWFFYLSLPLLAMLCGVKPPVFYLTLSIVSIVGLIYWGPQLTHLFCFLGGIFSSYAIRSEVFRQLCITNYSSVAIVLLLVILVYFFGSTYNPVPIILLSIVFSLVAGGNNLFGILIHPLSKLFGEMAYSIYLLHGIVLYITFEFIIGRSKSTDLSKIEHWSVIVVITPMLLVVSYLCFLYIEKPFMAKTPTVSNWFKSKQNHYFRLR